MVADFFVNASGEGKSQSALCKEGKTRSCREREPAITEEPSEARASGPRCWGCGFAMLGVSGSRRGGPRSSDHVSESLDSSLAFYLAGGLSLAVRKPSVSAKCWGKVLIELVASACSAVDL